MMVYGGVCVWGRGYMVVCVCVGKGVYGGVCVCGEGGIWWCVCVWGGYMVVVVGVYGGGGELPKLIHIQWKLSNINVDTIGTTHACPECGCVRILGASSYIFSGHDNTHSGFSATFSGALACSVLVRRLLKHCQ